MSSDIESELDRALSFQADGQNRQALRVFEQVISSLPVSGSLDAARLASGAWQGKCQVLVRERRWSNTVDACRVCLERYSEYSDFRVRWAVGSVRWSLCCALAELSLSASGVRGALAYAELDSLIDWLGMQPERNFAPELAKRLAVKMRWRARDEAGLVALDDLVGFLAKVNDATLTLEFAEKVADEMARLFAPDDEDSERFVEAMRAQLDEAAPGSNGVDFAFSDCHRHRMARLAKSLNRLAELLSGRLSRHNSDAIELRALMLLHVSTALGRLGEAEAADQVFRQFAALDTAAIAACDRLTRDAMQNEADGLGDSTPNLLAIEVFKAKIDVANGRQSDALSLVDDLLARFSDEGSPSVAPAVYAARELRQELTAEPKQAWPATAASPTHSSTGAGHVVWRIGG